eukprot:10395909-Lingulodinium_polyedra.AAC.1
MPVYRRRRMGQSEWSSSGVGARPSLESVGYLPAQAHMETFLNIPGAGNGAQQCKWKNELLIALPMGDGTASLERYTAPTVPTP